jgi:hypothetical protein
MARYRTQGRVRRQEAEKVTSTVSPHTSSFFGLPRGLSVRLRPIFWAIFSVHAGRPKVCPRSKLVLRSSRSAGRCGSFTRSCRSPL